MACVVSLVDDGAAGLSVSASVSSFREGTRATARFHVVGEPVEVSLQSPDAAGLIRVLLQAAQLLCVKAAAGGVELPGDGWERVSLLLVEALVAVAEAEQGDG